MNIKELAVLMDVPEADAQTFVDCLRIWTDKGYTLDEAIAKHIAQMNRIVNHAVDLAGALAKNGVFVGDLHDSLTGK